MPPSVSPPATVSSSSPSPREMWLCSAALAAITLLTYFPVCFNGFVDFDDTIYVTQNRQVQAGLTPESLCYAWSTWDYGNWHPLTWMSLQLDYALFGENPLAFHLASLVWHIANAVLLMWWLARWTGEVWHSLVVTVLFAVHPLHVESVAWVAERKDVLSLFFLLVSLHFYDWYIRQPGVWRYLAVTAAFACGLMCKSMLVTLPVLLLLVDLWPVQRLSRGSIYRRLLEKGPWLAMSLALGVVTIFAQAGSGAVLDLQRISLTGRIANACLGYEYYLTRTFWPAGLSPFHPHSLENYSLPWAVISGLTFLSISIWATLGVRTAPCRTFGWWWFVLSLLPVIGLLQTGHQAYADRYSYIPHLGLLVLVVWEAGFQLRSWRFATASLQSALVGAAVLVCIGLTLRQITFWKDSVTLWERALSVQEANWMAHHHLAELRLERNELELAATHCQRLWELRPESDQWSACLGRIALLRENWSEAESYLSDALSKKPDHPNATFNMYAVALKLGKPEVAVANLAKYCDILPQDVEARCELGNLRAQQGDVAAALSEYQLASDVAPHSAVPRLLAGKALLKLGRRPEAKTRLLEAVKLDPLQASAHSLLGDLFIGERDGVRAAYHYEHVLALVPEDEFTQTKLRTLLGQ